MGSAAAQIAQLAELFDSMDPETREEASAILADALPVWVPLEGPQSDAYDCQADEMFYGGSAGGGKSDLLLGLSITKHTNSIIYRRESVQLVGLQYRLLDEILKSRKGWNGQDDILRLGQRRIEFGSCKDLGDEQKYQGRPHDMIGFDEITHFLEQQYRFLIGWNRTTLPKQRCRVVCSGNPPTNQDGQWVISYWGPWLDDKHPHPAKPGELRWYTTIDGRDMEVEDGRPIIIRGRTIIPRSRTFIPSRVTDNPFLLSTGYESVLQALPEPLRSQMLEGDFRAGMEDSAWQVIPTAWVDAAMARWTPEGSKGQEMDSAGVDVARGGRDKTVVATRHGNWYGELQTWPGVQTPDGATTAGLVVSAIRDGAVVHIDGLGVGGEVVGHLESNDIQVRSVIGYDTEQSSSQRDKATGKLKFRNLRALIWWRFRESLHPKTGDMVALSPDPELKADLCAPLWKLTPGGILLEDKDETKKRIGRSPDKGDAVVYASMSTKKENRRKRNQPAGFSNWMNRRKDKWDGHYEEVIIR